jgi:exonuclease SbcD
MRFIHAADFHLGYRQYGSIERYDDFSRAFLHIVEQALELRVHFVLIAGDLFEKRTVDPLAMRVAVEGFRMLSEASIPIITIEGNHERTHCSDRYSWVDFLDGLAYLYSLNPRFENGRAILKPYSSEGGAYVDLPGGVRVYGIKYYGKSTNKVFSLFADALAEMDHSSVQFTILLAHASLEGQLPGYPAMLKHDDLTAMRGCIDYLALGHIHKPYAIDGWIYNPGSPETWSFEEVAWSDRGYYLIEIQPGKTPSHYAQLVATPRRPFYRLRLGVDTLVRPNSVYDAVRGMIKQKVNSIVCDPAPVIELTLEGLLSFSRSDLDMDYIQSLLDDAWSPLVVRVRNTSIAPGTEDQFFHFFRLDDIEPGIQQAKDHEQCVFNMLCDSLADQLSYPERESRTVDGTERRDIVFFNTSSHGFWQMVNQQHAAIHVVFECKNTEKLEPSHVNQLVGYLGKPLGNLGIIVSRLPPPENVYRKAMVALNRHNKVVLFLSDEDLNEMVRLKDKGIEPTEVIERKYVAFSRAVQ